MHLIQYVSILNLCEKKSMKLIHNLKRIMNNEFEHDEEL
jgi:hypothetical protein